MSEPKWTVSETTAGKTIEIEIPSEAIRIIKAEGVEDLEEWLHIQCAVCVGMRTEAINTNTYLRGLLNLIKEYKLEKDNE